jgi:hypothetical protein
MSLKASFCSIVIALAALPVVAQTETVRPETQLHSTVELQYYNFENFFQAPAGTPRRDVTAIGAAYRALWARQDKVPDFYGSLSLLRYSGGASETSYTGQAGISKYGSVHWYDVYVERTQNGYAFDIDETRAKANITALSASYSYGINEDWRVGTDAYLDWTTFNVDADLNNDYQSLGVDVRYRGFGDAIQPRIGYVAGQRESDSADEDASDRYWFAELRSKPVPNVDLRVRYRDRTRDYDNIARSDDRDQWQFRGVFKQGPHLTWTAMYTMETVDSNVPLESFDRSVAYVSAGYSF